MNTLKNSILFFVIAIFFASCQPKQQEQTSYEDAASKAPDVDYSYFQELSDNSMSYPYKQNSLNYSYDDLEPYFDKETMELHYSKHHAGYTTKFNKALEENNLGEKSLFGIFDNISNYPVAVRNNGGGYYNHLLFWQILAPSPSDGPSGDLDKAINEIFGDFTAFQTEFNLAAKTVFGSGWAWLSVNSDGKLFISQTSNQDNPLMDVTEERGIPILCLDVWEHAYYLKYQNKRADFINNFWNIINWAEVERRYTEAIEISDF